MNILDTVDRGLWDKLVSQEKQEYFYLLGYPLLYKKPPLRYCETQSQEDTKNVHQRYPKYRPGAVTNAVVQITDVESEGSEAEVDNWMV